MTSLGGSQLTAARMDGVKLVRRLAQLKSAFGKKITQTLQSCTLWEECRHSAILYGQVQTNIETVRASFDTLVATYDLLELELTENVWEAEHSEHRN